MAHKQRVALGIAQAERPFRTAAVQPLLHRNLGEVTPNLVVSRRNNQLEPTTAVRRRSDRIVPFFKQTAGGDRQLDVLARPELERPVQQDLHQEASRLRAIGFGFNDADFERLGHFWNASGLLQCVPR